MADYDKVVKGIEHHLNGKPTCQGCVYLDVWPCLDALLKDALALLKEQETVKHGRWIEDETTYAGAGVANWLCSECKRIGGTWWRDISPSKMYRYCSNCGARMDGGTP